MTDRKWHKGPPPHVGWWNASTCRNGTAWRWWDGVNWSFPSRPSFTTRDVKFAASHVWKSVFKTIEWTHYYPANARVPRIDPRKAK